MGSGLSFVERPESQPTDGRPTVHAPDKCVLKKFENHCHMVAIYHAYYNFCRIHQTLRVTPAMEAGLTDHVWSLTELVSVLEYKELIKAA